MNFAPHPVAAAALTFLASGGSIIDEGRGRLVTYMPADRLVGSELAVRNLGAAMKLPRASSILRTFATPGTC
jgi:hypothetical protein